MYPAPKYPTVQNKSKPVHSKEANINDSSKVESYDETNATVLENLMKALEYEDMMINGILSLGREKTAYLVSNQPVELAKITPKEQKMSEQLSQLEDIRQMLNKKVASQLGMDAENPSVSQVCLKLDELMLLKEKQALAGIQEKLQSSMTELLKRNRLNSDLLKQSLEYVNFNLQILAKPSSSVPRYGRGGKDLSDSAPHRSMMDFRS